MTRKDLVESLRVLHERDVILQIKQTKKRLEVHFAAIKDGRIGLLVIPYHQHDNNKARKPKVTESIHNLRCAQCGELTPRDSAPCRNCGAATVKANTT